jgi:hypothetical protein
MLAFTNSSAPWAFFAPHHERSPLLLEETSGINKHLRLIGWQRGLRSRWHGLSLARNGSLLLHPLEEFLVVLAHTDRLRMFCP